MMTKIAVRMEKLKKKKKVKAKLEDCARRYLAIKNSIKRYEKDGSEYSMNHIDKLEKRLETVKKDVLHWNNKLEILNKK